MKGFEDCKHYVKDGGWGCTYGNDILYYLIKRASDAEKKLMLKDLGVSDKEIMREYKKWVSEYPETTKQTVIDYLIRKHILN